jgi:hypothetical protein
MTKVEVEPGNCGMLAVITAESEDGQTVRLSVDTKCPHVAAAMGEIEEVDGFVEPTLPPGESVIYSELATRCRHSACPVPSAVIKAVEVEAGLALPQDVTIRITKE